MKFDRTAQVFESTWSTSQHATSQSSPSANQVYYTIYLQCSYSRTVLWRGLRQGDLQIKQRCPVPCWPISLLMSWNHVCFSVRLKKIVKNCCLHWPGPHILSYSLEDGVWLKWHAKPLAPCPSPQIVVRAGLGSIYGSNRPHHVSLHGKLQKCKILQPLPVQQNPVYRP